MARGEEEPGVVRGQGNGLLVLGMLHEAVAHFGSITPENRDRVTRWVQKRVKQLTSTPGEVKPFQARGFDAKSAAAGDGE